MPSNTMDAADASPPSRPTAPQVSGNSGSVSHGDIDYFDAEVSDELHRNMTSMSTQESAPTTNHGTFLRKSVSDTTLAVGDGPFDFEKGLRSFIKRCLFINLLYCALKY
jgi:hypothetical protein